MYSIVYEALDMTKCPAKGVAIDIVEYEGGKGYGYVLSRDNLTQYSDSQIESIITWAKSRADLASRLSGKRVVLEKGE